MKTKKIIILSGLLVYSYLLPAQHVDVRQVFVATTEKEVYKLYNQMIDSARVSNRFLCPNPPAMAIWIDCFSMGFFDEISSRDTVIKFEQFCEWRDIDDGHGNLTRTYICHRSYSLYISNSQPIVFYERFLNYLKDAENKENYFLKRNFSSQIYYTRQILIKQYESGILNEEDSLKASKLIEQATLMLINDDHSFDVVEKYDKTDAYDKYMTDNIRQALINAINNPFYPTEYLDFYMSHQDTLSVDTVGIPYSTMERLMRRNPNRLLPEDWPYYSRFTSFILYKELGEQLGGLSPGQAYLERKKDEFQEKGYLNIKTIAEYAYRRQDKLLLKYLEEFKKKHPDYPRRWW